MGDQAKMILLGVVALIVGLVGGGGYGMLQVGEMRLKLMSATQERDQAVQSAERLRKMNDAAAAKYGKDLGRLIMAAVAPSLAVPPAAAPAQSQRAPDLPAAVASASVPAAPDLPAAVAVAPAPAARDPAKLIDGARAILAARNNLRASLDGVRALMNSEFDALAAELDNAAPDAGKVGQILESLKQNWPRKEKDMEAATRRLLADLGLLQDFPPPPPATAPAALTAPAPARAEKK